MRLRIVTAAMLAIAALFHARRQHGQQQPDEHAEFLGADSGGAGAFTHREGK